MRFSLADMLWTVTLLSLASAGSAAILWQYRDGPADQGWGGLASFTLGMSTPIWVGMGAAAPFRRKRLGALVGIVVLVVFAGISLLLPSIYP